MMRIRGWEKISGLTYKGITIVNPIHNAYETKYMADLINLNVPHKPKWELNVLTPGHKWKAVNDNTFHILLWDEDRFSSRKEVSIEVMKSIKNFRMIVEDLIDEILALKLTMAPTFNSHSFNSGLVNMVNNSGNAIQI